LATCIIVFSSMISYAQENDQSYTNRFDGTDGRISVRIPIGMVMYEKTSNADEVTIDDFGKHLVPGTPNLPSKIFSIAIPPGTVFVDLQCTIGEEIVLPDRYDIQPVPAPQINSQDNHDIQVHEAQLYTKNYQATYFVDDAYPESIVEFERTAGFRQYNLVDVRVNPLQYSPLSGTLTYYPDVVVHIQYEMRDGFTSDDIVYDAGEIVEQRAREIILNYDAAKEWYPVKQVETDQYPFVIITLDSLTSCVDDLVAWEQAKGKNVQVVTISWIDAQYTGYDLANNNKGGIIRYV
jgi:hypothetical protein